MNLPFPVRLVLAIVASLGLALVLLALFYVTEIAFEVWDRLLQAPILLQLTYAGVILLLAGGVTWTVWRLLRTPSQGARGEIREPILTETELEIRIEQAESAGLDVGAAQKELRDLEERRKAAQVYVALFGDISAGKTSLIKALLPDCEAAIDPRGGTTRQIYHYTWTSPEGDRLILTDMPGLHEAGEALDDISREEAQRAHVVVYLVEGDLTRDQYTEFQRLLALEKPIILALNKVDRYSSEELTAVRRRLLERVGDAADVEVVAVSAGGQREVIKVHPDGREERVVRAIPVQVEALLNALLQRVSRDLGALEDLRDTAVLRLAARKLDVTVAAHRRERAAEIVKRYTHKAIFGALAAVSPGADLIIQGYLGIGLIRALCGVYEVSAREVNVTKFLQLASKNVGKTLPLLLTVTGNALKSFPGVGTVAGGVVHAVGYGLIFESLGRAVAASLDRHGTLADAATLRLFEEDLNDDLEGRARRLAKMVFDQRREPGNRP